MEAIESVAKEVRPAGMTRQEWRRKQREASKGKSNIPTIVFVDCPSCKQHRHTKYLAADGSVEPVVFETIEVREEKRLVDVCQFCVQQYHNKDREYILRNLKQLQKAMRNRDADNTTDKDFNIDL